MHTYQLYNLQALLEIHRNLKLEQGFFPLQELLMNITTAVSETT